jgi:hypothetical protein
MGPTFGGGGAGAPPASTTTTSTSAPQATGTTATATHGVAFAGNLASFVGDITGGTAASYTAQIDWGNGTITTGIIARTGDNTFGVSGGVTYLNPGKYTVQITVSDSGGGSSVVTTTILVADARLGLSDDWLEEDGPSDDDTRMAGAAAEVLPPPAQPATGLEAVCIQDEDLPARDEGTAPPVLPAVKDALFIALADAQEEAEVAEGKWSGVPAGDGAGVSGWSDLVALPVTLLDELFALL